MPTALIILGAHGLNFLAKLKTKPPQSFPVHVIIISTHSAMNAVDVGFLFLWASSTVDKKWIILLLLAGSFYIHWL